MLRRRTSGALFCLLLIACGAFTAFAAKAAKGKKGNIPVSTFDLDGKKWTKFTNEKGKTFYYDTATGKSQWNDPRETPLTANQRTLAFLVFFIPFVLMIAGAAGYLYWIKKTRPEVFKGPKKVKGLKNWERALLPPKIAKPKDRARSASPPPDDAKKSQ
ncbi:hypothetical protein Vretimale_990 [Volvox reticuliferus]|uniref:WW domain-containing protein n=1 Tax=Volvox reticuliferus TaxID=1737510 RepID=A0A8J4FMN7_9CHLO|nr:hypothetical protein Vretifemale_10471 [Volvox reticuliferus]GIL94915.1 hypothetical protein Vretimale_990 [Volvox reticuliferus]